MINLNNYKYDDTYLNGITLNSYVTLVALNERNRILEEDYIDIYY